MDLLSLSIGSAVAKWALRLWSQDTRFEGLEDDLVSIVPQIFSDRMECRSVTRQFEALVDDIAKRVDPYLGTEITGADAAERTSAGDAVRDSLQKALISSAVVLRLDLDPVALNRWIRDQDPNRVRIAGLSEAGSAIYETLLNDASSWIVATAGALPAVQTQATAELLARDTEIIALLRTVLLRVPEATLPSSWGHGSADTIFENEYRRSVSRYCDRLQLFGVDSVAAKSVYSLSVAYISMSVVQTHSAGDGQMNRQRETFGLREKEGQEGLGYMRVEHAIGKHDQIIISGDAGSGKTTLLRWLALQSVSNRHAENLSSWNHRIPFVLPLRSYAGANLPTPEKFVDLVAPNLVGAMPFGWVHRVMGEGRAIILIDGLDEIPTSQRSDTKRWLDDLLASFPGNKFVVTTRPTAISREWSNLPGFHQADLLPMEHSDIRAFIAHWHLAAIKGVTSPSLREDILQSEKMITKVVREKQTIRTLCTSPLLCALVCALNLDRAGQIPENRMELYATALKMLVVHRDEARRIAVDRSVTLDYSQAEILLRSFAQWLHENGKADAEKDEFEERIARQLVTLHRIRAKSSVVAQHLLSRSGVLREPIPGRIDFVHRSFLEYLAALAIIEDNSISKLILHAHEDHWREVVIMAAGHAKLVDREILLNGIIDRGRDEPNYTHRLYLLAVACMETSPELGVGLQDRLETCLKEVIPPRNMTEAAAVASAGSVAVAVLRSKTDLATESAASVRALSLIGGDSALQALATYRNDTRVTVSRELIRAWSSFDAEEYAREVLSDSILDRGKLRITDPEHLRHVGLLKRLERVRVEATGLEVALGEVNAIAIPIDFDLSHSPSLEGLEFLKNFPAARQLDLRFSQGLSDISGLRHSAEVDRLDLEGCVSVRNVASVALCRKLSFLDLSRTNVSDISPIWSDHVLDFLILKECEELLDLGVEVRAKLLNIGSCKKLENYRGLENSTSVEVLMLGRISPEVHKIIVPECVTELMLRGDGDGDVVVGGEGVKKLSFSVLTDPEMFVQTAMRMPTVETVDLRGIRRDSDHAIFRRLGEHQSITSIDYWRFSDRREELTIPGFSVVGTGTHRRLVRV